MKNFRIICTIFTLVTINSVVCPIVLSQTKLSDISSILENPVEGKEVTLRGKIIEQQQGEPDYIFTDGTNEIVVQLENEKFPYNPDTTVEILGVIHSESQYSAEQEDDPTPEDIQILVNQLQVVTSNE